MLKTTALPKTPSPNPQSNDEKARGVKSSSATKLFVGAVVDLSWQLAVVVLVPIIGGFELDKHLKTTPALTIAGFIVAMVGTFLVLRRMLNIYGGAGTAEDK